MNREQNLFFEQWHLPLLPHLTLPSSPLEHFLLCWNEFWSDRAGPIKWNEAFPSKLATLPSTLRDEMNERVEDIVGVQLELSKLRLIPLLLRLYMVSTWCFISCCCSLWWWWRNWKFVDDGTSWESCRGILPFGVNSNDGFPEPKPIELVEFDPISWIDLSRELEWRNWNDLDGWSFLAFGLSKRILWGRGIWIFLHFLTLACPKPVLRRETTLLNLITVSPVSTINFLRWIWSWGWDKRPITLLQLSTAALLAFSTSSMFYPTTKNPNSQNPKPPPPPPTTPLAPAVSPKSQKQKKKTKKKEEKKSTTTSNLQLAISDITKTHLVKSSFPHKENHLQEKPFFFLLKMKSEEFQFNKGPIFVKAWRPR